MRIAFYTNNYLPVISGVVRSVSTYRQALTDLGHKVFVFAQEDNYQDEEPFIFRYPSLSIPGPVEIPAIFPVSPYIDWLLPHLKLDVIHTQHPVLLGQVAAYKAKKLDLPLVFTFHTQYREYTHYVPLPQEVVQEFLKDTVHDWLKNFMRRCQHIVVPSQSMLEILLNEYGLDSNYTVIPTGIDLKPYQQADGTGIRAKHGWEDAAVMISIGRLSKEKNWKFLLQSAAMAMQNHPKLEVVLLGDGPDRKNLERYAVELEIRNKVHFIGFVPFDEVPNYLRAANFFGFASTTETQGLVTMEAMAAGLPVIAVDASGTRDIVQNEVQGFLVDQDVEAFSKAVDQLLISPELYENFKQEAYARSAEFEIIDQAKKLLDVYSQAKEEKKRGRFVQVK
jgi:1,2-diacylglycerol 3-alpha-glucosyltransferase